MIRDLIVAIEPLVRAFESLGIDYAIAGSVASSVHGVGRSTLDVDLVADIPRKDVDSLITAILPDYYVDRDAADDAVRRRSMFNAIHLATMIKVDVYLVGARPYDRISFERRTRIPVDEGKDAPTHPVDTAEDTILHKLEWYRAGGEVSERQWRDVIGVVDLQRDQLDRAYLATWAEQLGVSDLLARIYRELGL
jgi:hypothetical protein